MVAARRAAFANARSSFSTGSLLLYIVVYMLDDLVVFLLAMATLRVAGLTARYTRYSHLVGGALLCVIGALLLLRPEWLAFG